MKTTTTQRTMKHLSHADTEDADRIAAVVYEATLGAFSGYLNLTVNDEYGIAAKVANLVASELGQRWACDVVDHGVGPDRCDTCGRIACIDGSCPVGCHN